MSLRHNDIEPSTSPPPPFPHSIVHIPAQFHSMTAGAGAGLVSSIVTCPLDVVKTRLQAQAISRTAENYESVGMIVRNIWSSSGFKGFYRGLGPTLAGYLPTWGIYFTVYDMVKDRMGGWAVDNDLPIAGSFVHIIAAMSAGATGTIMTSPLWVVKTRFMAGLPSHHTRYKNTLEAIADIYRHEGPKAFYKGLLPSLMGVSHVAVQFPLYEKAKSWADNDSEGNHLSLPPSTILLCSAFSKMVASLATYPHEVLRTRLQIRRSHRTPPSPSPAPSTKPSHKPIATPSSLGRITGPEPPLPRIAEGPKPPWQFWHNPKEGGVIDTMFTIKKQDGWRGFYRGLSINLVRTVPSSAVTMLTYELIMRRLSSPTS
ncbi:hypothetical protein L202_01131 [Cryptococcus amylolentus CBS 6039]|uniref:Solute carrier family 25 (Mitochondrial folate transporter), member 32 n=2 Tax=Cryptococcus amylolentus TaxID=104669 RepID=A0A1E3I2K0_9TREE|nr:hypothetical protein L202_01131 [Cryptococcus amylolentus CBS 6039]ODN82873.1 hypothetical protein L202_01131 [Cryptococcus amylolentus CBS 6039]ODO10526.1 hypothetical protein I350_01121 [Cryptococcus amylolentus CBS 6273]